MNQNTGMTTLGKAAERSAYRAAEHFDEFVPVADISFTDGLNSISIAGERRPLLENAQRQLANRLGIPFPYLKRCPEELAVENLSHWITEEKNEKLFFRFDGAYVRAIFTPRYTPVDNLEIINRLFTLGYGYNTPVQLRLDDSFMSISIPDSKMTFDLDGNGDRVNPGLCFANSEVGLSAVHVTAYMLRLVCANGMLAKASGTSASKRHISSTILDDFPMMAESANRQLAAMAHQFKLSMSSPVEDPEATLKILCIQFQVTESEAEAVNWSFQQEPGQTMFQIIAAFTKSAHYPGLSALSSHRLERVGGQVLNTVRREAA